MSYILNTIFIAAINIKIHREYSMEDDTFTIILGQNKFTVSKKLSNASQYISSILFIGLGDQQIQIDQNIVSATVFKDILRFCQINDYKEPSIVRPIRTNNLNQVIDDKNYQFIKEFTSDQAKLMALLKATEFLVCKGLKRLLAAVFACKVYFQDSKQAYQNKKKELGITKDITFEDEEYYKNTFIFEEIK